MSEVHACPHCGLPLPASLGRDRDDEETAVQEEIIAAPDLPPVELLASGSVDDNFVSLPLVQEAGSARHDPILGEFAESSVGSGSASVVADIPGPPPSSRSVSSASFPAINYEPPTTREPGPSTGEKAEEEDEEEEDQPNHRSSWHSVLLLSYASAITLAFFWFWMREKSRVKDATETSPTAVGPSSTARQASLSRNVEPPEPIVGEHLATIGKPLSVGSLEITPLEVKRGEVTLQRASLYAQPDRRKAGKGALMLLLKLRNTSPGTVFAPLDQGYIRERGPGVVDTFVETAGGERVYPYPLAVESEWSIVGQEFGELRPGEARVVSIVTAPDAPADSAGPFSWRVRLRTGINRTDTIGVRWPDPPNGSITPEKVKTKA